MPESVKCPECGIGAKVDIANEIMRSFAISEQELRQKCKHLETTRKSFICPNLQSALSKIASSMTPLGSKR